MAASINVKLAQNISYVFWHRQVCLKKLLNASVCHLQHFVESASVEDLC